MTPLPAVIEEYFAAWRSSDPETIRRQLNRSVAPTIQWCDPNYDITGIDAVVEMIVEFHHTVVDAELAVTTDVDTHHDRYRYEWLVSSGRRPLVRGADILRVNDAGLISRIDGFFGPLVPKA